MRRSGPAQEGQALVETALLLPVVLLLVLLVLVGGQLLRTQIHLTSAARAGAQAAAAAVRRGASPLGAAQQAAQAEGTPLACAGPGVPAGCVAVAATTGARSGITLEVVSVYASVQPWWGRAGEIQLVARAAAAP